MHICVALVGISYDPSYVHRKIKIPIVIDATTLVDNQTKFVFDDLKSKGHTFDVVLSTNKHKKVEDYTKQVHAIWVDTNSESLHEREREVVKYAQSGKYDGCLLFRCDLVFKSYVSFMNIDYSKFNFPCHQVMYERWKEFRFKRVPVYNKNEVGGGLYYIPNRLYEVAIHAFDSIIVDDRIHHLNEYFEKSDIHFISNRRYQANTDVIQNPLFEFQRSSMDTAMNPNLANPHYLTHFKKGYKSVRNVHPDFEKCIELLGRLRVGKIN
jgi:hypothetical protein